MKRDHTLIGVQKLGRLLVYIYGGFITFTISWDDVFGRGEELGIVFALQINEEEEDEAGDDCDVFMLIRGELSFAHRSSVEQY